MIKNEKLIYKSMKMLKKSVSVLVAKSFLMLFLLLIGLPSLAQNNKGWVVLDLAEIGANISSRYTVTVNGVLVPVIKIQGGQVPSYVHFSFAGKAEVNVTVNESVNSYILTPKSYGIVSAKSGNEITFALDKPRKMILHHVNSSTGSLAIFADGIEENAPKLGDRGVINVLDYVADNSGRNNNSKQIQSAINMVPTGGVLYFPPGIYTANGLNCKAKSTIYIAAGAVIQSTTDGDAKTIFNIGADDVTIKGRGVLDGKGNINRAAGRMYNLLENHGNNWKLEGIILRNPTAWNIMTYGTNLSFRNVKCITGMEVGNTDGIGMAGSRVTIDDCIIVNTDDPFTAHNTGPSSKDWNIHVNNSVAFNQVAGGRMIVIGYYASTGETSNFNMENIDHANGYRVLGNITGNVLEIWPGGNGGGTVTNCTFNNIRSENPPNSFLAGVTYWDFSAYGNPGKGNGKISNIKLNEISQEGFGTIGSQDASKCPWPNGNNSLNVGWYKPNSAANRISGISFTNYTVDGLRIKNTTEGKFNLGDYVTAITFPTATNSKVNINATALIVHDGGNNKAVFKISRTGNTSKALAVNYNIHGTAVNGKDYKEIPSSVIIPANSTYATIAIAPKAGGGGNSYKTVFLSLVQNPNYMMDANYRAVITIQHGL